MENIQDLSKQIVEVHQYFKNYANRQINNALTLRNWIVGYYLVEYEQEGKDRATYGEKTLKELSAKLSETGTKGFSDRNLRLYRQFYLEYPAIWQFLTAKFQNTDNQLNTIWQSATAKLIPEPKTANSKWIPASAGMTRWLGVRDPALKLLRTLHHRNYRLLWVFQFFQKCTK